MKKHFVLFAWALSIVTASLAIITWYDCLPVTLSKVTVYDVFPVFGLVAFSLMWSHYMVGALHIYLSVDRKKLNSYYRITAYAVLATILIHPGLLELQLFRDGFGILPYAYVGPKLTLYVILGQVALVTFLAYESHRFFRDRSWWHYVERAGDIAMFFILIHAYKLGCSLLPGWFRYVWFFYGVTLIAAIGYATYIRHTTTKEWL